MKQKITQLQKEFNHIKSKIDITKLQNELSQLEKDLAKMADQPYSDEIISQTKKAEKIRKELKTWQETEKKLNSLSSLSSLLEKKSDPELEKELKKEIKMISKQIKELSILTKMHGPYDQSGALLSIYAGQGGLDAQDWTRMLLRMYLAYFEKKNWPVKLLDQQFGEQNGLTSASLEIDIPYGYGYLKNEKGIHRLVRISPFNAQGLRHTSFAAVEVLPILPKSQQEITIPSKDLEFKTYRASGPGGQFVNKTSTAVQLKHTPTGITVRCSNSRSQSKNRQKALSILKMKLIEQQESKKTAKIKQIKGEKVEASWGQQTRNYVLNPYKLIKDLKSGVSTSQVEAVLDGDLDIFIQAFTSKE